MYGTHLFRSWQDVAKFQSAFSTILKGNMDGLKKPEKKKVKEVKNK